MFLDWCRKEGVIGPKLDYPAIFENGVMGIGCKEEIKHQEMYLAIPYKMIYSASKVANNPLLAPIIQKHPECFTSDQMIQWQYLTLTLGLLYEISLGRQSYFYPWLRSFLVDQKCRSPWKDNELEMV